MDLKEFWAPYCGAVSLAFDDGNPLQLQKAIPLMDEARIRGTFYLNPHGENWRERLAPWRQVAQAGHEIGNHSLTHTCSNNLLGSAGGLEDKDLAFIESDILAAQERLVELAPHQKEWTFAYPCYNTTVGRGLGAQSYVPVVAKHFLAGRARGEYGFANHPLFADLAQLSATPVERWSGLEMIGHVEGLAAQGQWLILVFHEIDGARLTVGRHDFRLLLTHLHQRRDAIWTAPGAEVAKKILETRG